MIRTATFVFAALAATSAIAAGRTHRDKVAQIIFLAQAAPKACSDYTTNDAAVAAYMADEKMSQREFMTDHTAANTEIGDAFAASFKRDSAAACKQICNQLGEPGLGLITADDD